MKKGITFIGSMCVDHIKEIEELPQRSDLCQIKAMQDSIGGLVCNSGIDLAVLDPNVPVYAGGAVGNDADGDLIVSRFEKVGIDTSAIIRRGCTSFTDVFFETSCTCRTFYQYGGACDTLDVDDIRIDQIKGDILHIGYLLLLKKLDEPDAEYGTKMARVLHNAQQAGIITSIDVVSAKGDRFQAVVTPSLKYTDLLCINEVESERITGIQLQDNGKILHENFPTALRKLKEMGVGRWVVIHFREGAYGIDENGEIAYEASKDLPAGWIKGSVGAGDAFCSGVLLAAYRELSVKDALIYGNASAMTSLRTPGATEGMTTIEEALELYHSFT